VMQNSVVQGLRTNINQLEVKLKEARGNLGAKHPQYIRMEAELAELRNRLALETSHAASSYSSSSAVGKAKEAELKAAFDAQTRKILGMKNERDEIAVLVRDVETARKAYDAVTSRLTQTNLESQATRTNISVINSAVVPIAPSFPPTPERTLLIALLVGAVLAVAYALGLELLDQRIRTADDLADMLQVPVLAVIEPSPAAAKLAYRRAAALPSK
jgi:succinoglycan biosynthesis transport protein ExoP